MAPGEEIYIETCRIDHEYNDQHHHYELFVDIYYRQKN